MYNMSGHIIHVIIPNDKFIPESMQSFTPEENLLVLKIGSDCLLEGRKLIAGLTQKEIYNKIKSESKADIEKLELDILVQKEMNKKMEENIEKIYTCQIDNLTKKIEWLNKQIYNYECKNKDIIKDEEEKAREKYELLLKEKDIQNQLNREVFDKATLLINKNITSNKSSVSIGDDGENIFENLTETFKDFNGYKIENKSKQGHKGDFHLFFEEFNVLVDSKNYTGFVQKKEVNKIEADLMVNDNMKFAWMVSLNTPISEQNRFPITSKWINTDVGLKCILFINNLLSYKEPANILRQAWYMSSELNKLIKDIKKEDMKLENYREKELKQKKQIESLQERIREMRRNINTSNNILKNMDKDLLDMLSEITDKIVNDKLDLNGLINIWWNNNLEYENNDSKLTSSEIWNKFKRDNKDYINENKITIDSFKEIITSIVNSANYIEKNKNGSVEFIGYKFKEINMKELENIIIEKEIPPKMKKNNNEISKKETNNKINKNIQKKEVEDSSLTNDFIKEEVINKIVLNNIPKQKLDVKPGSRWTEKEDCELKINYIEKQYDIIKICQLHNRNPGGIMTRLQKLNIIDNLEETRGYDLLDKLKSIPKELTI